MVKMLELRCLENGDVVLVEAEGDVGPAQEDDEPLVRIRFSPEVRDMLGDDTLGVAEAMIEAATAYISGEGDLGTAEFGVDTFADPEQAELEEIDEAVSTAPVVLH